MQPSSNPVYDPFVHAVVHAGTIDIRYARAGSGAPVVLIVRATDPDDLRVRLATALTSSFRVIAPEVRDLLPAMLELDPLPTFPPVLTSCLCAFLEGLGLAGVSVVADHHLAALALGFALMEPDRVERLVLLQHSLVEQSEGVEPVVEHYDRAGQELAVLRLWCDFGRPQDAMPEGPVLREVAAFLTGERTTPT